MKHFATVPVFAGVALAGNLMGVLWDAGICEPSSLLVERFDKQVCSTASALPGVSPQDKSVEEAKSVWQVSEPCYGNATAKFCVYSNPSFAHGRGLSFITSAERAALLAKSTVFTDPSAAIKFDNLNIEESIKWSVEDVVGKDKGVIAARRFDVGDHIMSASTPMLIDYAMYSDVNAPEDELRRLISHAVSYLPEETQRRYMQLSTHYPTKTHEEKVEYILNTNCFELNEIGEHDKSTFQAASGVFPELSRFNHDCRPNADYYFDHLTLTQHVHAIKPIMPGEEITISYIDPLQSHRKRQHRLSTGWHFGCSCSLCTQSEMFRDASDERIDKINEYRQDLMNWTPYSRATPEMAELVLSLYEQERLDMQMYQAYTWAAIEWNGVGEPWKASKYAALAVQYGLAAVGPTDSDVTEMEDLLADPWTHWSWMLRTNRRMRWGADEDSP